MTKILFGNDIIDKIGTMQIITLEGATETMDFFSAVNTVIFQGEESYDAWINNILPEIAIRLNIGHTNRAITANLNTIYGKLCHFISTSEDTDSVYSKMRAQSTLPELILVKDVMSTVIAATDSTGKSFANCLLKVAQDGFLKKKMSEEIDNIVFKSGHQSAEDMAETLTHETLDNLDLMT